MRIAAAAARKLGMAIHIQLEDRVAAGGETYRTSGNLLLDRVLGATLHPFPEGEDEAAADAAMERRAEMLAAEGRRPYVIHSAPGHPPLGGLGYVLAAEEIVEQAPGTGFDAVVCASGSALTHAGILVGLRALGERAPVLGICVRRDAASQGARVAQVASALAAMIECPDAFDAGDVDVSDAVLAPGYGRLNEAAREAMAMAAGHEGLLLDPVYTAKAMAGLIPMCVRGGSLRAAGCCSSTPAASRRSSPMATASGRGSRKRRTDGRAEGKRRPGSGVGEAGGGGRRQRGLAQDPVPERPQLGPLAGGGGGDQAAALGRFFLTVEERHQDSAFELVGDQHRAPDGGAESARRRLDQHRVEAEARGPREVRRGLALAGEPVGPVGVPAEVVEQRPVAQRGRAPGTPARGQQRRAAHRQERLLVEGLLQQGLVTPGSAGAGGGLAGIGEPGVEVAPRRVDAAVVGLELDGDAGMGRLERGEPRQQPLLGHRLDRDDAHPPGGRALALGDAVDLGQDALDLLEIGPAAAVEVDAAAPALEQLGVEMLLQGADAVADGGGGDAELLAGQHEALVAGGGLEEAQAVERGKVEHGDGPDEAL